METDLEGQLRALRRRIRRIERKKPKPAPAPGRVGESTPPDGLPKYVQDWGGRMRRPSPLKDDMPEGGPARYDAETLLDGRGLSNEYGSYFLSERLYANHQRHGSMEISHLAELPGELLGGISRDDIPAREPRRWAFLDTETTGLAGGTGTCAFLVGVGTIDEDGFRVRLFFMRDYDEEPAMLAALSEFLAGYDVLVTYNGKAYDAPLLETRYRLKRLPFPIERMHHLDLLHGARRLWKLRLTSCRLMDLEYEILGVERQGDLPGELIPYYYFEYLKTKQAFRLVPLLHHNVIDIVSLACLTAVVLPAFDSPTEVDFRHGADMLGLARWLNRSGDHEQALELYRRATSRSLSDENLFAALWETALLEKKRGDFEAMTALLADLTGVANAHRVAACEELAKHYEHRVKDLPQALAFTEQGIEPLGSPELLHRKSRIERKLARRAGAGEELFLAGEAPGGDEHSCLS